MSFCPLDDTKGTGILPDSLCSFCSFHFVLDFLLLMYYFTYVNTTCGIYGFRNLINGKWYIGQSIHVEIRRKEQLCNLRGGYHPNQHLQRAFSLYGESNFEYRFLECLPEALLDAKEREWISFYKSAETGYNSEDGGSLHKHHSLTVRKRISESLRRQWQTGARKPLSVKTRQKISATLLAKHSHHTVSTTTRKKLSDKFTGRPIPLEQRLRIAKTLTGRHPSESTRFKLVAASKLRPPVSPETRLKMVATRRNRGEYVISETTRKKISRTKLLNNAKRRLAKMQTARIHVPILQT